MQIRLFFAIVLLSSLAYACQQPFGEEEAATLIKNSGRYPKVVSTQIYFNDTEDGRKAIDSGLVKAGVVEVDRTRNNEKRVVIQFTKQAQPYLMDADPGQLSSIQKVKVAEEVFDKIIEMKTSEDGSRAAVSYQSKYVDISPFSKLHRKNYDVPDTTNVLLVKTEEGWQIQP
jgi:hypothetical protein